MSKLDMARHFAERSLEQIKNGVTAVKTGRNDPCYCGSGKKYKQCHMAADRAAEQAHREQVEAARFLRRDLLAFARDDRFAEGLATALPLYWNHLYDIESADEMAPNEAFRFFDWFVFDYQSSGTPRLIQVYHDEKYSDLATSQQHVMDSWLDAPPTAAYELLDYEGQTLKLRDFITGDEYEAYEPGSHGDVKRGDLILTRLVPVTDHLEFSTVAAYVPQDEITDLAQKLETARNTDKEDQPDADHADFMRRHNHLIVHHALEQAERKGRPPVARLDPDRSDSLVRGAAQKLKKLGVKSTPKTVPATPSSAIHDKGQNRKQKV